MTIWLAGHGHEELGARQVTVPDGWSVSTYCNDRTVLEKVVGYEIARTGIAPEVTHVTGSREQMPNYRLEALTFVEALDYRTIHGPHVRILLAGHDFDAPTGLCTGENCSDVHDCDGILGSNGPLSVYGDTDIRLISCQEPTVDGESLTGHALLVTDTLPGEKSPEFFDNISRKQEDWITVMRQAHGSEARRQVMAAFEALGRRNPELQVLLLQRDAIRKYCYSHYAGEMLEDCNAVGFYIWVESLTETEKDFYLAADGPRPESWQQYNGVKSWLAMFMAEEMREGACRQLPSEARMAFVDGAVEQVRDEATREVLRSVQRWAATALQDETPAFVPSGNPFKYEGVYFNEEEISSREDSPIHVRDRYIELSSESSGESGNISDEY
ncbi:putative adhesin [Streptomyces sp. NPDC091376]|uniref:putative adhesin n=1 Tax=Streptomyces sp. NPDC091376 TaxID=3365994 RepID=UPI003819B95C